MKTPHFVLIIFLGVAGSFYSEGCAAADVVTRPCKSNPTSYVFDATGEEVVAAVSAISKKHDPEGLLPRWKVRQPVREGDQCKAILDAAVESHPSGTAKYPIYFYNDRPAPYHAHLAIVIAEKPQRRSHVAVANANPYLWLPGHRLNILSLKFDGGRMKKVKTTTIEEYENLLMIGRELEQKGMPPLNVPEAKLNTPLDS